MGFCLQLPLSVPEQADRGRILGLAGRGAARCPSPDTHWCSVTELTRNAAKSRSLDVREAVPCFCDGAWGPRVRLELLPGASVGGRG